MTFDKPTTDDTEQQVRALPLRMLHDRILVHQNKDSAERRSSAGIVIPATAQMGRRLSWATVVAVGPAVRHVELSDRVLFDPDERHEVELNAHTYLLLRERDLHAVAEPDDASDASGMYL